MSVRSVYNNTNIVDNARVSILPTNGVNNSLIPRMDHLVNIIRREFQYQQKRHEKHLHHSNNSPKHIRGEKVTIYKGLYRGVSFALIFQVPALALFLSTYDATKHGLVHLAHLHNLQSFQLYHSETHLVSGLIAKATGTTIWAPMQKIQSLATHPVLGQVPLTLKEACRIGKNICQTEGFGGLWSGYSKSLSALLPYTMIYFATYEQLKQIARWMVYYKDNEMGFQHGATGDDFWDRWVALREYWSISEQQSQDITKTRLTLDTYMMCVASAVIISSTVCQAASTIRATVWDHIGSSQPITPSDHCPSLKNRAPLARLVEVFRKQPLSVSPISPLSPTKCFPTSLSAMATTRAASGFKYSPFASAQFKTLTSNSSVVTTQSLSGHPWKQRHNATLTTTSVLPFHNTMTHKNLKGLYSGPPASTTASLSSQPFAPGSPPILKLNNNTFMSMVSPAPTTSLSLNDNATSTKPNQTSGLVRTIARSLGPRILWTVPGVTLTTAGFEFLRGIASGPSQ
ncbi:hypothetical protein BGZ80_001188 [Entomortierella chlamydospora]|uniref:Mitochondrial carrier protein n=1 Tax=Entomortierella chlamydospora TaxID=101097 RepID=A0A9P6MR54_9FUNG|nr:hypothetical protein BGZ79_002026 [Entomortierella chlamydospora]KAG0010782.1 hypothetical protein BGZ80_001188 [Entomortierella chlamydospora]